MDGFKKATTGREAGRGDRQPGRFTSGESRPQGGASGRDEGEKAGIRSYRELRVYQAAMEAATEVFALTGNLPAEEHWPVAEAMRSRALSLCVRLGEAWRRRRAVAQFVGKLEDAEGDAEGMRVCVELAARCHALPEGSVRGLDERYDKILGQLYRMISEPEPWTIRKEAH